MTTPPQGNPFAQQPPAPGGQFNAYPAPPAPAPPRRNFKKIARNIVLPIAGIGIAVGAYLGGVGDDTLELAAGDCLQNTGSTSNPDIEKLECTDAKATHKVLKKVDGTSLSDLACQSTAGTVAAITWKEGSDSFVLCLGNAKK
ncbi:hypothetical protein [Streptomyces sp. SAJ15]|uniref:LppU/SCO3897 family protein n=1 Tax=Streptomyces sp. SAJ15 TaxID=2011095 RepID=UPI001184B9D5|nr:hypothetical protein [Streptomyces sp. SAJ15]TVL92372.1 hypothetical protein CD790_11790 [Streptomyces sp. SAJ15]